jgi:hypothetical protein
MARHFDEVKLDLWRARLAKFDASYLTVAEFCRGERVSLASYYYWSRRIRESGSSAVALARRPAKMPIDKLPQQEVASGAIEVWLRDGVRVLVPSGCTDALRLVMQAVCSAGESSRSGKQAPAFQQVLVETP